MFYLFIYFLRSFFLLLSFFSFVSFIFIFMMGFRTISLFGICGFNFIGFQPATKQPRSEKEIQNNGLPKIGSGMKCPHHWKPTAYRLVKYSVSGWQLAVGMCVMVDGFTFHFYFCSCFVLHTYEYKRAGIITQYYYFYGSMKRSMYKNMPFCHSNYITCEHNVVA